MTALGVRELELDLDAFEGPFDLLLTLVLKEELALSEIEIAEIVVAFVERLGARPDGTGRPAADGSAALDMEACGEFLVLAAALLELKARELFAEDDELDLDELDADAAAAELAERLAEYRRIKAGAEWLAERLESEADRFFRLGPAPLRVAPVRQLAPQDPQTLAASIRALAVEPAAPSLTHLALRFPPVAQFLERFRAVLRRRRQFLFDDEVEGLSRVEQAVAFLAILELRKTGEIRLGQPAPFEPITIWAGSRA